MQQNLFCLLHRHSGISWRMASPSSRGSWTAQTTSLWSWSPSLTALWTTAGTWGPRSETNSSSTTFYPLTNWNQMHFSNTGLSCTYNIAHSKMSCTKDIYSSPHKSQNPLLRKIILKNKFGLDNINFLQYSSIRFKTGRDQWMTTFNLWKSYK